MKRKIISTFTISKKQVRFNALEELDGTQIEIYSSKSGLDDFSALIQECKDAIKSKIGGNISNASVVIETYDKADYKINYVSESLRIAGNVAENDINTISTLVEGKQSSNENGMSIVGLYPIRFITDTLTGKKEYSVAPINRPCSKLTINFVATQIKTRIEEYIKKAFRENNLNISQILLSSQAASQVCVSESALEGGAILVNVSKEGAYAVLNLKSGSVSVQSLKNSGTNTLAKGISGALKCNNDVAHRLLNIYANVDETVEDRVIHRADEFSKTHDITLNDLTIVTKKFVKHVIEKLFEQFPAKLSESLKQYPIVLVGDWTKIDSLKNYVAELTNNNHVSIYSPLSFIERDAENRNNIGVLNYSKKLEQLKGIKFESIIETNPETLSTFMKKNKPRTRTVFSKLFLGS